jgi:hypothetical protein
MAREHAKKQGTKDPSNPSQGSSQKLCLDNIRRLTRFLEEEGNLG